MKQERLIRLARAIDALAEKDARLFKELEEVAARRRVAALELYTVCASFVEQVNSLLAQVRLELEPAQYSLESFQDPGANLIQINARGRLVQIEFRATDTPTSTELFRVPYILHGGTRSYNQDLLERLEIHEHLLFYCVGQRVSGWWHFDPRTYRSGVFDADYLAGLLERLV